MSEGLGKKRRIDAVVLLSGGVDSCVAAALAVKKGRRLSALAVDYGQRHKRELKAARAQARRLGADFQVFRLPLGGLARGSLVDGGAIRKDGIRPGRPATYVSFRNGVLLSLAAALAEKTGAREIWGGWCLADRQGYADCRPAFLKAFEKAARLGTGTGLKVVTPLSALGKEQILRLGLSLGVDFSRTWTCYFGAPRPCGRCDACRLRARGFAALGRKDPL